MENSLIYFSIVVVILFWIYKRLSHNDNGDGGIFHERPLPIVGNILPLLTKREGIIQFLERNYWKYENEK